ncbi:DUF4080 domain-containing protein [Thermodesulfobacteriota bacterium]
MKITLVAVNGRYTHSCLALYYLRNRLHLGLPACEVDIQQYALNDPYHETLLRIIAGKPDAILFSAYIWSSERIQRLLHDLARVLPETPLVVGGPQAVWLADKLPPGCAVVEGEAEGLPDAFFTDLAAGQMGSRYSAEPGRPFVMPYNDEDFSASLKNRQIYYESTRGCPFACSYCLSAISPGVVYKDLEVVREELTRLVAHQPPVVRFVDRTFNARADRALALWRFLADLPGETCFHFEIAPELFTDEMLAFLATVPVGRFQFEIGLQSTNPETLAAINRTADPVRIGANFAGILAPDNIHLHLDLILGLPFESRETFARSFNHAFALTPHYIQMGLLKILPGTPLAARCEEFGLLASETPPYEILASRWLRQEQMAELYWFGECVEAFYNNRYFRSFFSYIRRVEPEPFVFFSRLLACCREHDFFEQAKTQKLMSRILLAFVADRSDQPLLKEFLRYDWLRSGHRFLPDELADESLSEVRDRLYHSLPDELPSLYDRRSRNRFFKKSNFLACSGALLAETGMGAGNHDGVICFPVDGQKGVLRLQQGVLLPAS